MAVTAHSVLRLLTLAALLAAPAPTAAAAPLASCHAAAFSPAFARDRTVFCLTNTEDGGVRLYESRDGGRTWSAKASVVRRHVSYPDLILSPAYPEDPTLFVVSANDGMWVSRDGGRSFAAEQEGPMWSAERASAYVENVPLPRAAFVEAPVALIGSGVFDASAGSRTVVGTPGPALHYVVPPDYAISRSAVGITWETNGPADWLAARGNSVKAYACHGDFVCTQLVHDFGDGSPVHVQRIGVRDTVVVTIGSRGAGSSGVRAWRSRDFGWTWQRWSGVERLFQSGSERPAVHMTAVPDRAGRLFAEVDVPGAKGRGGAPARSVWRSDDDGATWRRVAYARGPEQPRPGEGTLPWNDPGESIAQAGPVISAQPGGLLYGLGARKVGDRVTAPRLWCSRDAGRTWRTSC